MDTVKIRELRGTDLQQRTRSGRPLALTNRGNLIAVLVPVTRAWVEHLIDYNWSHVRQSIDEGERAMAAGEPMATIDDVMALPGPGDGQRGRPGAARTGTARPGRRGGDRRDRHAAAGDHGDPGAAARRAEPAQPR